MKLSELTRDPKNANRGTLRGDAALERSLQSYGAGRSILIDKNGVIIAGNKTVENALQVGLPDEVVVVQSDGKKIVAVQRMDLDIDADPRARELAIADNRVAQMNLDWDPVVIRDFKDEGVINIDAFFSEDEYKKILKKLEKDHAGQWDAGSESRVKEQSIYELKDDPLFASSNKWGIPDLRSDRMATPEDFSWPNQCWAKQHEILEAVDSSRTMFGFGNTPFQEDCHRGILHFYVDDQKFMQVWDDAVNIAGDMREEPWAAVVEPDFSTDAVDPLVVQMFNVYKSRWCGRYFQEVGVKLIPNMMWGDDRSADFVHLGIPQGTPVLAVQSFGIGQKKNFDIFMELYRHYVNHVNPEHVIIYRGADFADALKRHLPEKPQYHLVESWVKARDRVIELKKEVSNAKAAQLRAERSHKK